MFPREFDYDRPKTLDEALLALASRNGAARPLAGGHSILPMLKLRMTDVSHLVDLQDIAELKGIRVGANSVSIGSLSTHREIEYHAELAARMPILAEAAAQIADPLVRNRGTIGGSLAYNDPSADWPAVMLALDARLTCRSVAGERVVPATEFFVDMMQTVLESGELITGVVLDVPAKDHRSSYVKHRHPASGYAVVGIAVSLTMDEDICVAANVGVTGAAGCAFRAPALELALTGQRLTKSSIAGLSATVLDGVETMGDKFISADYRAHLLKVHTERALLRAISKQA